VLAGLTVLVTAALAELVLRQFFEPVTTVMNDIRAQYYEPHPTLGWLPKKSVVGVHKKDGSFATSIRTNSRGLRDQEHDLVKPPSVQRIVVIGDSFTWGWGVEDHEMYSRVLETLVDGVDTVNLGVTGFNTRQEVDYLALEGLLYQPDVVVLGFCLNDIYEGTLVQRPLQSQRDRREAASRADESLPVRVKGWLNDHLALYQLTKEAANANRTVVKALVTMGVKDTLAGFDDLDPNLMPAARVYPPAFQRAVEKSQKELLDLAEYLGQRQIRFILVLIPSLQSMDAAAFRRSISYSALEASDFDLARPYRELEGFARKHGIEVVNGYDALAKERESGETLYLKQDVHFNPVGQKALARAIAAYWTAHPIRNGQ
jgi:lysophospholipase L1-like esterase